MQDEEKKGQKWQFPDNHYVLNENKEKGKQWRELTPLLCCCAFIAYLVATKLWKHESDQWCCYRLLKYGLFLSEMSKSPALPQTSLDSFASHPSLDKHRQEMNVVLQWFIPYWKHFLSKKTIQSSFAFTCLLFSLALAHKYLFIWRFLYNPPFPCFSPLTWIVVPAILPLCFFNWKLK